MQLCYSKICFTIILLTALAIFPSPGHSWEVNSKIGLSSRFFQNEALYDVQHDSRQQWSILSEVEVYHDWNNAQDSLLFKPYIRLDEYDDERTHFDVRELMWLHVADTWELRSGISKVFWGVNEANHLVDIINQDDLVDDINDEAKLGQAMINLSLLRDWGVLDLFILPGFRERTFPGKEGRLRGYLVVDTDNAEYESAAKQKHTDFAIRWSHTISDYDIGVSYFQGTNREPHYKINLNSPQQPKLIPY